MLECQRDLFDLPEDVAYLNCAYMSPLMRPAQAAARDGLALKVQPWRISPPDFFTGAERARALYARLVNARADDVAIVPAASYGVAVAALNVPLARGQEILMLEEQYPANVYAWRRRAAETGARIRTVTRAEAAAANRGIDWTAAVLEAIGERTAVVALPHCHWTDGTLVDLERVGARARTHGTALVLDVTQSGGALPIDVARVDPDFMVNACYKWLLGPYSLGFLYVAPRWQEGRPLEETWIGRKGSEDFAGLVDYQDDYQPGARRFDMGERANFHLLPIAEAALGRILEWGVDEIAATLSAMTAAIAERAAKFGFAAAGTDERAGHYLGLRAEGGVPDGLLEALAERGVFVSVRGDSIRVTPHLYNSDEDVERFFAALRAAM